MFTELGDLKLREYSVFLVPDLNLLLNCKTKLENGFVFRIEFPRENIV